MEKCIYQLAINITDICNMECPHCLRGDGHNRKFDLSLIPKIFEGISQIDAITITGGEPSCYVEGIKAIVDYLVKHKDSIIVNGFYIVTNAKEYCQDLVDAVKTMMFVYLERCYANWDISYDNVKSVEYELEESLYTFAISVSMDMYHKPINAINYLKYRTSGVYSNAKETNFSKGGVIWRGRGKNIHGSRYRDYRELFVEQDDECLLADEIYVTVNGYVYGDCDMSYEMEDEMEPAGNLRNNTLAEIIEQNVESEE